MKTTVEIPDTLFRKAKATAAEQGVPLKDFLTNAVREYLQRSSKSKTSAPAPPPAWMSAFGGLRNLHKETKRIDHVLEEEFGRIDEEEWR